MDSASIFFPVEVVREGPELAARIKALAPHGIDHIVEMAFKDNIDLDVGALKIGGSITTYATHRERPDIPFWPMVFQNARVFFLGSDDFPREAKAAAAQDLSPLWKRGGPVSRLRNESRGQKSRGLTKWWKVLPGREGLSCSLDRISRAIESADQPPREIDRRGTRMAGAVNFERPSRLIDSANHRPGLAK
jgi:hypothetical protein